MVMNTIPVQVDSNKNTAAIGGSHWVTCVILPTKFTILGKQFKFTHERVFFIDSNSRNKKLPAKFREMLQHGCKYSFTRDAGSIELERNPLKKICTSTHVVTSTFNNPEFFETPELKQQLNGSDCGFFAVYNALMVILTGGIDYAKSFETSHFGSKLRTLFPDLAKEFEHIKENAKSSSVKQQEPKGEQSAPRKANSNSDAIRITDSSSTNNTRVAIKDGVSVKALIARHESLNKTSNDGPYTNGSSANHVDSTKRLRCP